MAKPRVVIFLGEEVFPTGEGFLTARKMVAKKVSEAIANLVKKYEIVLVYQNSPVETENIFRQAEKLATTNFDQLTEVETLEKDGYILERAIYNALAKNGQRRKVATILTQNVVARDDKNLRKMTRPVGRIYSEKEALKLIKMRKWTMKKVAENGYRRFLPEVAVIDVVEKREIGDLLTAGAMVVAENGGAPVYRTKILKTLKKVEAVVVGELAAEKLAELLKADIFVSVLVAPALKLKTGVGNEILLRELTAKEAKVYLKNGQFGPEIAAEKIEAQIRFSKRRKMSVLCGIGNLEDALNGKAGTKIYG